MSIDHPKLGQLQHVFPNLTQTNQQYILGLTEGLSHAQRSLEKQGEGKGAYQSLLDYSKGQYKLDLSGDE
jgi:hypothetical protein